MRPMSIQDEFSSAESSPDPGYSSVRPRIARGETDRILSYYENHAAAGSFESQYDSQPQKPYRRPSTSSSSEYSPDDAESTSSISDDELRSGELGKAGTSGTRRPSVPSEGGADRRRIAIVEMGIDTRTKNRSRDSSDDNSSTRTRRALGKKLSSIKLVAPPDASPNTYRNLALSPPTSAPAYITNSPIRDNDSKHQRSASEAVSGGRVLRRQGSRDVGIVGPRALDNRYHNRSHSNNNPHSYFEPKHPHPPVFQQPTIPQASDSFRSAVTMNGLVTPEIGQEKDIRQPVVGPVVVDATGAWSSYDETLLPSLSRRPPMPFSPTHPNSYLHYQPGIHSTAGPPPPPIQRRQDTGSSVPPPRPPRLNTPALSNSSRSSRSSENQDSPADITIKKEIGENPISDTPVTLRPSRSMHIREGAHPPSTTSPELSTLDPSVAHKMSSHETTSSSPTSEEAPIELKAESPTSITSHDATRPGLEVRKETSWVNLKVSVEAIPTADTDGGPPPSPSTTTSPLRATFSNLKRFSALPRSPSLISMGLVPGGAKPSRTPSPSLPPIPARRKMISPWPVAMQFNDVTAHRSALERSLGYANKINELAMYDCGLGDWVISVKHRGAAPRTMSSRPNLVNQSFQAPSPLSAEHGQKLRQTSHGSMTSEATFPRRRDAYTATDLSPRPDDIPTSTPLVPYPSLAPQSSRSAAHTSVIVSPTSTARHLPLPILLAPSKSTGGFFSSLGRKASGSKKLVSNSALPAKLLSKRQSINPNPRPVQLPSAPNVVGGPRALPGRSQSIVVSRRPSGDELVKSPKVNQRGSVVRRPSLFPPTKAVTEEPLPTFDSRNSAEFNDQLEKLVILLPHADRGILAGYLRRSGQDILAVGRYLEDEKNGTIMRS